MMRFDNIVTLPSGNTARDFSVRDLGNDRVRIQYVYTDRRRAHQVSRRYTVEFLNGRLDSIIARSANGGRVELFKSSTILAELLEMLAEFNEVVNGVAQHRYAPAKVEAEQDIASEDDSTSVEDTASVTSTDLMNTVRLVGIGVVVNLMVTLATIGIVWYNL